MLILLLIATNSAYAPAVANRYIIVSGYMDAANDLLEAISMVSLALLLTAGTAGNTSDTTSTKLNIGTSAVPGLILMAILWR